MVLQRSGWPEGGTTVMGVTEHTVCAMSDGNIPAVDHHRTSWVDDGFRLRAVGKNFAVTGRYRPKAEIRPPQQRSAAKAVVISEAAIAI